MMQTEMDGMGQTEMQQHASIKDGEGYRDGRFYLHLKKTHLRNLLNCGFKKAGTVDISQIQYTGVEEFLTTTYAN